MQIDMPETGHKRAGISLAALLAAAYILAGWLGLQLAVPPGYATVIWPASGIALAGLLIYGWRLWPGVFLGSLAINAFVGNAFGSDGVAVQALLIATCIALGSTLQAVFAATTIRRLFGFPIVLKTRAQIILLIVLAGPLACLIAATIGVTALNVAGVISPEAAFHNWQTWWLGDLMGIAVVLPIALFGPWRSWSVQWSGQRLEGFSPASFFVLLVPLGLTFYGWYWTSQISYDRNRAAFHALAQASESALIHRLNAYSYGLDGAAGLMEASQRVTLAEWRTYVDALDIGNNFPGINGIGFISAVEKDELESFLEDARLDGVDSIAVHPDTPTPALFIIRYIEPIASNRKALGLNIAFEQNRYEAAITARDTGKAIITKRIVLVQDATKSAGFLLLRPFYNLEMPANTVEERRAAFRGWIFAPFVGNSFMKALTASQGDTLDIAIFTGSKMDDGEQIYSSRDASRSQIEANYSTIKRLSVKGQNWTVVWKSTPAFDALEDTNEAWLVLAAGLVLTALFGAYLLSFTQREDIIRQKVDQKTREISSRDEQNRSMVNTAVVAILLLDEQGKTISANGAAETIFGYASNELVGLSIDELLGRKQVNAAEELLAELVSNQTQSAPVQAKCKDGSELQLDLQINSWTTADGGRRFTVIIRDISQELRTRIALLDAEERWSIALEGANIGVFDIDLVSGRSIVSDTWRKMLGFGANEDIDPQSEWLERVHPEDLALVQAADRECFEGRTTRSVSEYRIRHKDQRWIWVKSEAIVRERQVDGTARRFVGTQIDITALKKTELALRTSEERFRSAIENAPVGMALLDLEGKWLMVNDALCSFLGYGQDELLGLALKDIAHPDELDLDIESMQQVSNGELTSFQLERRYLHKSGHFCWGFLSVSIARDPDDRAAYFIAQILDIDDRKQMDRLKSEFISNVSHELRTPLTSIRGSIGLITGAMSKDIPDGVMRLLSIAHKNCDRLIMLINDILDLEKISAEETTFDIEECDINEAVEQAIEVNQGYADQFGVTFQLHSADQPLHANIDPSRFQQVLSNLMSNAVKFSPKGGQVRLALHHDPTTVRVLVSDDGPGIPADFRARVFAPFSQADASATRQKGGTGLGLHIAKQMMERMNGRLNYESVEGVGTTFWIELPLVSGNYEESLMQQTAHEARNKLPAALHVEDDADFSAFISTAVSGVVSVTNATSIEDAKRLLSKMEFDLIIIDVELPDGNGLVLLDDAAMHEDMSVIVLTASENVAKDRRIDVALVKSKTPELEIAECIRDAAWWRSFGNDGRFTGVISDPDEDEGTNYARLAL